MRLVEKMAEIVQDIQDEVTAIDGSGSPSQIEIVAIIARRYDLWQDDLYPTWLSRLVRDEMQDSGHWVD